MKGKRVRKIKAKTAARVVEPIAPADPTGVRIVGGVMALLFAGAALSQARLQTVGQAETIKIARETNRYERKIPDPARRGAIYSSDGKPLAKDEESFEIAVNFGKVPNTPAFWMDLASATDIPASEFSSLAASNIKSRAWEQVISVAQKAQVDAVRERWRADGVSVKQVRRRAYPLAEAVSTLIGLIRPGGDVISSGDHRYQALLRVIGSQPKDSADGPKLVNGKVVRDLVTGIESTQDSVLKGANGVRIGFTDRAGALLPMREQENTAQRRDGADLVLTIDSDLQQVASEALKVAVEKNQADNGVALIMDPKTGDLLAMANWPSYKPYNDDGSLADLPASSGMNPSTMSILEPGSTFKILTLAKALDSGKVHMSDTIHCTGEYHLNRFWRVRCDSHHGNRAHGDISPEKAIAESCNIAAAQWALKVGRTDFLDYVDKLGILAKTNIGVPGELYGRYKRDEYAKPLQLANIGFGQSISVTPVGLIGAFGMLGNDGIRVAPRLIKRTGARDELVAQGQQIVRPETAHEVLRCMESVMSNEHGTGKGLDKIAGYRIAGKTGTAQKIGGHVKGYVSNFVGFVPANNPKAVILVMVNNPKGGNYYGATVAGPVFVSLAKAVIRRYSILPTEPMEIAPVAASRRTNSVPRKHLPPLGGSKKNAHDA